MGDPFLHYFKARGHDYVYDARSNIIFETFSDDTQQIRAALDTVYRQNWGEGIDDISVHGVKYPYGQDVVLDLLRNNMEELILGVTDSCNFRCRYCIYGGSYEGMRTHRNVDMSEETGRRAIDEFARRSRNTDNISLGFYGGEPLLKWGMIQGLVIYANEKMKGKKIIPNMTTNGWLLTPDKFSFLRDNGFMLLISLDGSRYIHDRNRRTAGNEPTYDRILKNLDSLNRWDSGYYRDHVMFSYVVENPFEMGEIDDFFANHPLIKRHFVVGGLVDPYDNDLNIISIDTPEKTKKFQSIMKRVLDRYSESLREDGDVSGIGGTMMSIPIKRIRDRPLGLMNGTTPTSGICIPGVRKLFVTTDGRYHPCEKAEQFDIGGVQEGFSEEKSIDLIHKYEDMSQGLCDKCWAVRLCPSCYVSGSIRGELSQERQKMNCGEVKDILESALSLYVELLEDGIDLSDRIEKVC